ncbi:MHYT domain-containing protein [Streptomyces sp. NPDC005728]|uniref:MHYT domain-containing protein n=1 Tax=Streptomyces sp. NPDC005728 TaxID=3157054 RepID=UPI0033D4B4E4
MAEIHHFSYGWWTPAISYVMAFVGSALGLRCTMRALSIEGPSRRNWLLTAAVVIGSGIWTMHFIAMLGFGVVGSPTTYDVPLTVLSLLVAIVVVGLGVFTVGYGRSKVRSLLLGGLGTGLGVAAMHYMGMAAVQVHGHLGYDLKLVGLSVAIAVAAATAALGAAITIRNAIGAVIAALVMGLAVSTMHYTAMAAVRAHVLHEQTSLLGTRATDFIFPLIVTLGSFLFLTAAFVALSPPGSDPRGHGPSDHADDLDYLDDLDNLERSETPQHAGA